MPPCPPSAISGSVIESSPESTSKGAGQLESAGDIAALDAGHDEGADDQRGLIGVLGRPGQRIVHGDDDARQAGPAFEFAHQLIENAFTVLAFGPGCAVTDQHR